MTDDNTNTRPTLWVPKPIKHATLVALIKVRKKTLTQIRMLSATRAHLWMEACLTHPDNLTRHDHPLMPTPNVFMGLPIYVLTPEETDELALQKTWRRRIRQRETRSIKTYEKRLALLSSDIS